LVVTARRGVVSIGGDGRRPHGLGFGLGKKLSRGRRRSGQGSSRDLYGSRASLVTPSMKEGSTAREEKKSTAWCCRPCARRR
jgi:hypothetical protein